MLIPDDPRDLSSLGRLIERASALGISIVGAIVVLMIVSHVLKIEQARQMIGFVTRRFGGR